MGAPQLYYRLLEVGAFESIPGDGPQVQIDAAQVAMLLVGMSLGSVRRKRYRRAS